MIDGQSSSITAACAPGTKTFFRRGANFHHKVSRIRETFVQGHSSIRVRPKLGLYKFETEKPRGGSRGAYDTHIFPALSPETLVSRRDYSHRYRVSTAFEPQPLRLNSVLSEREQVTRMKPNSKYRIAALFVALAMVVPAFAKPFTKTISISKSAKFGKASVAAGEYKLSIEGNKATVHKGKNTVAESEGRWEDRAAKSEYTSILLGEDGQVREVRFAGEKRVFVFSE